MVALCISCYKRHSGTISLCLFIYSVGLLLRYILQALNINDNIPPILFDTVRRNLFNKSSWNAFIISNPPIDICIVIFILSHQNYCYYLLPCYFCLFLVLIFTWWCWWNNTLSGLPLDLFIFNIQSSVFLLKIIFRSECNGYQ